MIWFTSDWHLNHRRIIEYCGRPFTTADDMNTTLIKNLNADVSPGDLVYHLGDFALYTSPLEIQMWLERMHGDHVLITGNHDRLTRKKYMEAGFVECLRWEVFNDGEFNLIHDPAAAGHVAGSDPMQRWICGHVHHLFKRNRNALNVGVDVWGYKPVSIETVRKEFEE